MVTTDAIKSLRDETGISVMECKRALEEAHGNHDEAIILLRKKGSATAKKKSDRTLGAGTIAAYIHSGGDVGVLVYLSSETDFVSKNEEFKKLSYDIAMHIAAVDPSDTETLLGQTYIKDESMTIQGLIESAILKFGEKIVITEFSRFSTRD